MDNLETRLVVIESKVDIIETDTKQLLKDVAGLKVRASFWGVTGAALVFLLTKLIGG